MQRESVNKLYVEKTKYIMNLQMSVFVKKIFTSTMKVIVSNAAMYQPGILNGECAFVIEDIAI